MTAVAPNFSQYRSPNPPTSKLVQLDVPPLNNFSLALGCYFVSSPYAAGAWNGCLVFRSPDGGVTWVQQAPAIGKESIIGFTVTALPNWLGGFTLDTNSVVRVQLIDITQSLTSITIAQMLSGLNLAILTEQLIQL